MAILRPAIYEHNNPLYPIVDSDFLRGSFRTAVADVSGLYALSPNFNQLKERATFVYVTSEAKYYVLVDINNVDNASGWQPFVLGGGGSGTLTGATNGLQLFGVSGDTVGLGGNLITGTTINTTVHNLTFSGTTSKILSIAGTSSTSYGYSCVTSDYVTLETINGLNYAYVDVNRSANTITNCVRSGNIILSATPFGGVGGKICVCSTSGITYNACFHDNYNDRTLVDKEYVDNKFGAYNVRYATPTYPFYINTSDYYIGVTGYTVSEPAYLYLLGSPALGQTITITDLQGQALQYPITIDGNGININGNSSSATINTDYGSISFMYNGIFWSAIGFVN